jgi:hypothetical protein
MIVKRGRDGLPEQADVANEQVVCLHSRTISAGSLRGKTLPR